MKSAHLILIAAVLIFSCKKKEEVVPEVPKAKNELTTSFFKMDGDASDSTGTLAGTANNVVFGATTATFNGTDAYIKIPAEGTISTPDQLTFSLFFKATYDALQKPRLLQMNDEMGNAIEIYIENSRIHLTNWDEAQRKDIVRIMTPSAPDLARWNKVVATVDFIANTMSLYVNDQLVETVSNVTLTRIGNATIHLGLHQHPGDVAKDFYYGEMDNVGIYGSIIEPAVFARFAR